MKKHALLALAAACILFPLAVPQLALAGVPCVTQEFKTQMIKDACTKGGQDEAKKIMKKFLLTAKSKEPRIQDCTSCHSALSPNYPRKPIALELLKRVGGK